MIKLLRITTVSMSFRLLLKGQLKFMSQYFETHAASSSGWELDDMQKEENTIPHPVSMERVPAPIKDLRSFFKIRSVIGKIKPTIVHTHTPKAGLLGMIASYTAGVPIRLHTVAGIPWMESKGQKRKLLRFMEKITYRFATHVYSNSEAMLNFILDNQLIRPGKISVIGNGSSNGIDTDWYDRTKEVEEEAAELREKYKLQNCKVILFVGRLVKDKGIEELLWAYKELKKEKFPGKLLLVGPYEKERDPLTAEAEKLIREDEGIIATGYVKDVRPYMAASHILAFPSYREGFPNVPMQAGALGLPAVVTNINGCNEIIEEGVNGLIIPPKDSKALKNALLRLLTNNDLYNNLSSKARPMITTRFEQRLIWKQILKEYHRHLKNKGIPLLPSQLNKLYS